MEGEEAFEDIVKIVVGGKTFMTESKTLKNIPNTLLSEIDKCSSFYKKKFDCYFFDRDPMIFHLVIQSYRTGKLHLPSDLCMEAVLEELEFWKLDPRALLAPCCLETFFDYEEKNAVLDVKMMEGSVEDFGEFDGRKFGRYNLWMFLEKPSSSRRAQMWMFFQVLLIYVLMLIYAMMTSVWAAFDVSSSNTSDVILYGWATIPGKVFVPYLVLRFSDLAIQLFFTIDLVIRLALAPNRKRFLKKLTTIIDVICITSFWIYTTIFLTKFMAHTLDRRSDMIMRNAVIVIQVLRLVKVTKLSSNSVQLTSLMLTIRHSLKEILILNLCFVAVQFLFAVAVYYAEYGVDDSDLRDIPMAFWWALITTTTIGYGDAVPKSTGGYIVGCLCALTGILLTGLAISVLANNLSTYSQLASQIDRQQRRTCTRLRAEFVRRSHSSLSAERESAL